MKLITKAILGVTAEFAAGFGLCYAIGYIKNKNNPKLIREGNVKQAIEDGTILIKTNIEANEESN